MKQYKTPLMQVKICLLSEQLLNNPDINVGSDEKIPVASELPGGDEW